MNADNGIYIVKMPTSVIPDETGMTTHFNNCPCTEGYPQEACRCFEYRVIHAQAIAGGGIGQDGYRVALGGASRS